MQFAAYTVIIILLFTAIIALVIAIVWLQARFQVEKKKFSLRLSSLQAVIADTSQKQLRQYDKARLSDDIDKRLEQTNSELGKDIAGLNYELFEILSKNNLLGK